VHMELSDEALTLIAARFKALSEPNRLKLIIALEDEAMSVSGLMEVTRLKQANVSRHLQTLVDAGILARQRNGLTVMYSIADPGIFELCQQVCGGIQKRLTRQAKVFGRG
jgi:DNA-binding transcriptional ArsR family regulator